MDPIAGDVRVALNRLLDEQRTRCLWFLRPDWYPDSMEEALRALDAIQRHGDRDSYQRAARMRAWLSRTRIGGSAGV